MTERRTLGDLDFESELDDPDDNDGWFGSALTMAPVGSPEAGELRLDAPLDDTRLDADTDDTDRWYLPPAVVEPASRAVPDPTMWTGVLAPRNGRTVVAGPQQTWESKLSDSGAWDFKVSAAAPWYRSRRLVIASVAVAVAAIVATGILVLLRSPGADESVSPTTPGTAESKPAEPTPALSSPSAPPPPALPAPPPPPPPTAAEEITGPATRPYSPPRRSAPSQSDMPEIGVTRTPVTRAPLSATPPPPRAPDRNSATPGDAPKGGWGRW